MADTPIRHHTKIRKQAHLFAPKYDEYFEIRTSQKWRQSSNRSMVAYQLSLQQGNCPCCGKKYCTYDLILIGNEIGKNNLDIETIESFANFVNLYSDFVNQDERNAHLHVYADNELIRETWDYFYDCIFWPRFNDKEKFEAWDRPQLVINSNELLVKLNDIIKIFDVNIKQTEMQITKAHTS